MIKRSIDIFQLIFLLGIVNISFANTPKIYAVVIGVANYKDGSIPNLKYSEKDAQAFHDFLRSPYAGAVPEDNIALLIGANATRSNIITSMVDIFKRSTKDDMIIFYFSGHGEADEGDNSGYLLCYDAVTDNAPATALSMDELQSRISRCKAKLKVSYVDACHAGLFKSEGKGSMEADNEIIASTFMENVSKADDGNVAFLASSAKQQSQESDKLGNGVFTYYLLKGLKGDADKEQKDATGYNDGLVTVGEMVTYLADKVPAATKFNQKPTVEGVYDEGFPLSVLTSTAVIASEIAKRPEKKSLSNSISSLPKISLPILETETVDMKPNEYEIEGNHGAFYGGICFVNNSKEDILLYYYWNEGAYKPNVLVSKGEKNCITNIVVYGDRNHTKDVQFYFKTVDETKPTKYGTLSFNVESCKAKTQILTSKNLYLSTSGEKQE